MVVVVCGVRFSCSMFVTSRRMFFFSFSFKMATEVTAAVLADEGLDSGLNTSSQRRKEHTYILSQMNLLPASH